MHEICTFHEKKNFISSNGHGYLCVYKFKHKESISSTAERIPEDETRNSANIEATKSFEMHEILINLPKGR